MNKLGFDLMGRALVLSVAMVAGCAEERNCTAVACGPSSYRLGSEPWPPGDYEVVVAYEPSGRPVELRCSAHVGEDSADGDDAGVMEPEPMADCTGTTAGSISVWATDRMGISMNDSPASFELSIEREGRVLFDETVTPDYEASEINGPGCGVCRTTNTTIDLADSLR